MNTNNSKQTGVNLLDVTFITLLILKLFGLITISWWWVFSPLLINVAVVIIAYIILLASRK